jgi:protein-S-isoprenylcysteine O-methyltransferase Ste14
MGKMKKSKVRKEISGGTILHYAHVLATIFLFTFALASNDHWWSSHAVVFATLLLAVRLIITIMNMVLSGADEAGF